MQSPRNVSFGVLLLALTLPGFAQSAESGQGAAEPQATAPAKPDISQQLPARAKRMRAERGPQCWRLAGITPDMMNQRWKINDEAQGRVKQVCADPTLSAEKRQERIHDIDDQRDKEIASLIPTKELDKYRSCQAERDAMRPVNPNEKQLGPCGGIIPQSNSHDSHDAHEHHAGSPSPTK